MDKSNELKIFDRSEHTVAVQPPFERVEDNSMFQTDSDLLNYLIPSKTQGRKGEKTPRMNLAIPQDVYVYIRRMSKLHGMTYSEFICAVMRQRQSK